MQLVEPKSRTWTRSEYHKMGELGWFAGQRVELVEGEIVVMSPQNFGHSRTVDRVAKLLHEVVGRQFWVRSQLPLALPDGSEPEPDVSVVAGQADDYADHPTTAILAIEVSDTTLAFDRTRKLRLFAGAGIPHYWIINLVNRTIEVHGQPDAGSNPPRYAPAIVLTAGDVIAFPGNPTLTWNVGALLG
ncbi:MAG TPA: Uma2 family endonuclease [Tepidisphaeraceae bacterium]|nr:Uma2 family endonuclease [Tepidisphaeraceae bacterium]